MALARLFLVSAGGGSGFTPPSPGFVLGGPYGTFTVGATVLTQLHCHTTNSDGTYSPAAVVADYLGRGYEALALTDHNVQTSQPAGITTAIPGNELGINTLTQHIIALNSTYNTLGGVTNPQTIIDNVRAGGGEAHIAHPNWIGTALSAATIAGLTDYYGIEIHNGKVMGGASAGVNPVTNPGFAVEKWDDVLATKRDTFAVAVDDLHQVDAFNTYDMGRVYVFAAANTMSDIISSLVAGRFVADIGNYGVTPGYPVRGADSIEVTCTGAVRIEAWGDTGLLGAADADTYEYPVTGDETYVRMVAWGDYTEPFSSALPHPWTAYTGSWSVGSGVLSLSSDATGRVLALPRHREGDFEAQVDIRLADDRDVESASLLFNVLNQNYYFLVRIGTSNILPSAHNHLAVYRTTDGSASINLVGNAAFTATPLTWYTVKMAYTASTGGISCKVWERGTTEPDWMVTATDTSWTWGGFGLRANWAPQFDNFYVKGFKTYYQPITVDPS